MMQSNSHENARVLIVDDDVDLLRLISIRLKPMNFELKTVTSAEQALNLLSIWPADLMITDVQMPGLSGIELFEKVHAKNPLMPVIVLTAHGTIPDAVAATQAGVAGYLTKPFDSDVLIQKIQHALNSTGYTENNHVVNQNWRNKILGQSASMEMLLAQIERLADDDSFIVFEGETGTGKDELASALHQRSYRAGKSLIHLSCTSLPPDLLEAEVFGRVGQQTDTSPERIGLLKQAEGGTILLSDFHEAPTAFLSRFFNSINENIAKPVNSDDEYSINVRGIATTTFIGQFQNSNEAPWSLAHKIGAAVLSVPSLKERPEDIPIIASHCLSNLQDKADTQFSNKAMQVMMTAEWPGNVRQLLSVVNQCARLSNTKIISDSLVQSRLQNRVLQIQPLTNAHMDFERDYLTEVLKLTNGNVTKAANIAKRNRTEFHRLLNKHQIEAKSFREQGKN